MLISRTTFPSSSVITVCGGRCSSSPGICGVVMTVSSRRRRRDAHGVRGVDRGHPDRERQRASVRPDDCETATSNTPVRSTALVRRRAVDHEFLPAGRVGPSRSRNRPVRSVSTSRSPIDSVTSASGSPLSSSTCPASAVTPAGACSGGSFRHGESSPDCASRFVLAATSLDRAAAPAPYRGRASRTSCASRARRRTPGCARLSERACTSCPCGSRPAGLRTRAVRLRRERRGRRLLRSGVASITVAAIDRPDVERLREPQRDARVDCYLTRAVERIRGRDRQARTRHRPGFVAIHFVKLSSPGSKTSAACRLRRATRTRPSGISCAEAFRKIRVGGVPVGCADRSPGRHSSAASAAGIRLAAGEQDAAIRQQRRRVPGTRREGHIASAS